MCIRDRYRSRCLDCLRADSCLGACGTERVGNAQAANILDLPFCPFFERCWFALWMASTCAGQRGNLTVLPARFHIELEYHYVHPELAVPLGNRPLHCACGSSVRTEVALKTTTDCLRNYLGD